MVVRDRKDISDRIDLVAQGFRETGFNVASDESSGAYSVSPCQGVSDAYGSFSVQNERGRVMVLVHSENTSGLQLARDVLRDAGVEGTVRYK